MKVNDIVTAQIFALYINKSYRTLEVCNNNVESNELFFSIYILFLLQKEYMAQPLLTASSTTDEQLIHLLYTRNQIVGRR